MDVGLVVLLVFQEKSRAIICLLHDRELKKSLYVSGSRGEVDVVVGDELPCLCVIQDEVEYMVHVIATCAF